MSRFKSAADRRLDFLYAFQNEKRVFAAAHHAFKQVVVFASKGGCTQHFHIRFRLGVGDSPEAHEIPDDILRNHDLAMVFTPNDLREISPKTLSMVELKSKRDLAVFRRIYTHSIRIGDNHPGWELTFAQEINMTSDSKHFPRLEKWEAKAYKPDVFGRWIGPEGDVALPLYQGAMIWHFNPTFQWFESGAGRVNKWIATQPENATFRSKYLIDQGTATVLSPQVTKMRFAFRDISSSTNERTFVGTAIPGFPCGNTLPVLYFNTDDLIRLALLTAAAGSLTCDYVARIRMSGSHMNYFVLQDIPIPFRNDNPTAASRVVNDTCRLIFLHRRFAPEWLRLKHLYSELSIKEWKHWWAVTEVDRLRLRVEIDALCADLYGLEPDDFDWIVRDDPKDPKGFYRVDKHLSFRERLTGLAAAAFRALKEGKWSAESAAKLSNDEFFALIGIPELTTGPDPLIRKRTGCHVWKPEEFGPDDPRLGWTWDHCWQDAVALLGSEEAVQRYIAGKPNEPEATSENESTTNGPKDLFGNRIPTDLFGSELRTKPRKKKQS